MREGISLGRLCSRACSFCVCFVAFYLCLLCFSLLFMWPSFPRCFYTFALRCVFVLYAWDRRAALCVHCMPPGYDGVLVLFFLRCPLRCSRHPPRNILDAWRPLSSLTLRDSYLSSCHHLACGVFLLFFLRVMVSGHAQVPSSYGEHLAGCFGARHGSNLLWFRSDCSRSCCVCVFLLTSPNNGANILEGFLRSGIKISWFMFTGAAPFSCFVFFPAIARTSQGS